jgi:hypothetical protein
MTNICFNYHQNDHYNMCSEPYQVVLEIDQMYRFILCADMLQNVSTSGDSFQWHLSLCFEASATNSDILGSEQSVYATPPET